MNEQDFRQMVELLGRLAERLDSLDKKMSRVVYRDVWELEKKALDREIDSNKKEIKELQADIVHERESKESMKKWITNLFVSLLALAATLLIAILS